MASGGPCLVFLPAMLCDEDLYRSQIERLRDLVVAGLWLMGCNPGPYRQTVERGLNARVQAGEFDAVVDELAKAVVSRGGPHAIPAMATFRSMARRAGPLGLPRRPVAVTFRETPPVGVPKFTGTEPSGCSFWRIAAGGRTFYTVASDHYNCPIGSYTHHLALPHDRSQELDQTLSL